ncbi:MAG: hypothetical protein V3T42_00235 [Nitrospirales bacterium]
MNWTTLLRFRRQVEDLAREEVVLKEWEKSQEVSQYHELNKEMETVVTELEQRLQAGMAQMFVEQRYQWLDKIGVSLETQIQRIQGLDTTLVELRQKLKEAYHARRVVELVIAKKEAAVLQKVAYQEQRIQEDLSSHVFVTQSLEQEC